MATVRILAAGNPARLVPAAFLAVITIGTALLALPIAAPDGTAYSFTTAVFTATSATCVTGLVVVDTGTDWSMFGQVVILALIQIGGFGLMTLASLLALVVFRKLRLRGALAAGAETRSVGPGDVTRLLRNVALISLVVEVVLAAVLALRFAGRYEASPGEAIWQGVFHSISAFNNAGFALWSDSLMRFVVDPIIIVPMGLAFIVGGLGFPILYELRTKRFRVRRWTVHTKITLLVTAVLIVIGWVAMLALEWSNPATLGPLSGGGKLLASWFSGITPRTAGFNNLDTAAMRSETWLVTDILMFIGGGSAGTAGGIKVTTFALLGFVIWSEIRGEPDVHAFGRRIAESAQRAALTVALLGVGAIALGTLAVQVLDKHSLDQALFEVISAFGTVGLSTGITADLSQPAQWVLTVLMFVGRVGPVAAAAALALRSRQRLYRYPVERPIVG